MVAVAYEFPRLVSMAHELPRLVSRACEVAEANEWKRVHLRLRRIAKKRAALDREELALIREAIRIALWRHVGATSIREYLERECGYGPHVASGKCQGSCRMES